MPAAQDTFRTITGKVMNELISLDLDQDTTEFIMQYMADKQGELVNKVERWHGEKGLTLMPVRRWSPEKKVKGQPPVLNAVAIEFEKIAENMKAYC